MNPKNTTGSQITDELAEIVHEASAERHRTCIGRPAIKLTDADDRAFARRELTSMLRAADAPATTRVRGPAHAGPA